MSCFTYKKMMWMWDKMPNIKTLQKPCLQRGYYFEKKKKKNLVKPLQRGFFRVLLAKILCKV